MKRRLPNYSTVLISLITLLILVCFVVFYFVEMQNNQISTISSQAVTRDPVVLVLSIFTAIASLFSASSSLWNTFSSFRSASKLEELKQQLGLEFPALKDSRKAALQYYRTLAKLETQSMTQDDYETSEKVMAEAEGNIYFLPQDYQQVWYDYWQEARNISVQAKKLDIDKAQEEWKSDWAKQLASKLDDIRTFQPNS
jgi:hypothetical protein